MNKKKITLRLVRSLIGSKKQHRATVLGLGLRRLHSSSQLEDTPEVRGMLRKVSYLVRECVDVN